MIGATSILPEPETVIEFADEMIIIGRGSGCRVSIVLPVGDDDAINVLDRLRAACDNAASAVELRRQQREAASLVGAGESVEAYRG